MARGFYGRLRRGLLQKVGGRLVAKRTDNAIAGCELGLDDLPIVETSARASLLIIRKSYERRVMSQNGCKRNSNI